MKKCNRYLLLLVLLGTLTLILAGCGGGGSGPSGNSGNTITLKTSAIRSIKPGDTWAYAGSGTWNNGATTSNISGTSTTQILSSTKQSPITSGNCLDQYSVANLTTSAGQSVVSTHSYLLQDANSSINTYGADFGLGSGDVWVTSPASGYFLSFESPMAVGQNHGTSAAYTDGTTMTIAYSVNAIENVDTGAGKYEAYKITQNATINYTNGIKVVENNTIWYVPGLGTVKILSDATRYFGGAFQLNQQLTATLSSTSVAY